MSPYAQKTLIMAIKTTIKMMIIIAFKINCGYNNNNVDDDDDTT